MSGPSRLPRSGGILLHPTSLPGVGIGDIGPAARRFVDVAADMGLRWWQMLPVTPTGYGDSPYQASSSFAGNPLLVSLEDLAAAGLLTAAEIDGDFPAHVVDFAEVIPWKTRLLATAADRFVRTRPTEEYDAFLDRHMETWLDDFSVFAALKRAHDLAPWWEWPPEVRHRDRGALARARREHADAIRTARVEQFFFDQAFRRLRARCRARHLDLIGDMPIFVAHDSADVWANPGLFLLDTDHDPTVVAGVPPDYFSPTGQRWGNPLYAWDRHVESDFEWWTDRMRRILDQFDLVRIDHFRGFAAAWHIPASAPTATRGEWVPAPGRQLLTRLHREFDELAVIAEDLGLITPDVVRLRDEFGLPGMKVLQFGFGTESDHALDAFEEHVVAYTGTHDNDTSRGWFESADPEREQERARAMDLLGTNGEDFAWTLIEAVFASVAAIAIAPLQDLLSLGSEARMNTPGRATGNWRWRFAPEALTPELIARMAELTQRTGRR